MHICSLDYMSDNHFSSSYFRKNRMNSRIQSKLINEWWTAREKSIARWHIQKRYKLVGYNAKALPISFDRNWIQQVKEPKINEVHLPTRKCIVQYTIGWNKSECKVWTQALISIGDWRKIHNLIHIVLLFINK